MFVICLKLWAKSNKSSLHVMCTFHISANNRQSEIKWKDKKYIERKEKKRNDTGEKWMRG